MSDSSAALPSDAVLLHIGPHKTGTTAIQGMLHANRQAMAEAGVVYPGRGSAHHPAARALRNHAAGWTHDQEAIPSRAWNQLARQVRRNTGRVVISSEFFAQCNAAERRELVATLGADRLYVLLAARNPGSIAVSTWQQVLRDAKTGAIEPWLRAHFARPEPTRAASGFWSWADAAALAEGWLEVLPADRVRIVVVDESDRSLLPRTFESLLGLAPGLLESQPIGFNNRGLTAPEAALLLRFLERTGRDTMTWDEWSTLVRRGLLMHLLRDRVPPAGEARTGLPEWAVEQALGEADSLVSRLTALGVPIVGDLEHLRRVPPVAEDTTIEVIPVDLAAEALTGLMGAAQKEMAAGKAAVPPAPGAADPSPRVIDLTSRELARVIRGRVRRRVRRVVTRG